MPSQATHHKRRAPQLISQARGAPAWLIGRAGEVYFPSSEIIFLLSMTTHLKIINLVDHFGLLGDLHRWNAVDACH